MKMFIEYNYAAMRKNGRVSSITHSPFPITRNV